MLEPDEAAEALADMRMRREQVIALVSVPRWYWPVVAVLMIGLAAVVDTRDPVLIGVAAPAFAIIVTTVSGLIIFGARGARVRSELLGSAGTLVILLFVFLLIGCSLGVALALTLAGVTHPATIGALVGAVGLAVGGPFVSRVLRQLMLRDVSDT